MTYKEQLADPRWQKKRLHIFERDNFTCQYCLDTKTQLQVHHKYYDKTYKTKAWEYPNHAYKTVCSDCHKALTEHIEEYGTDNDFNVMKIKDANGDLLVLIYSNGWLKFNCEQYNNMNFDEHSTYKIVQFLINNWLKNG